MPVGTSHKSSCMVSLGVRMAENNCFAVSFVPTRAERKLRNGDRVGSKNSADR